MQIKANNLLLKTHLAAKGLNASPKLLNNSHQLESADVGLTNYKNFRISATGH